MDILTILRLVDKETALKISYLVVLGIIVQKIIISYKSSACFKWTYKLSVTIIELLRFRNRS